MSAYRPYLSFLVVIVLAAAIYSEHRAFHTAPDDAPAYREYVAHAAATEVPTHFGSWIGSTAPVPQAAVAILHPNVILAKLYQRIGTDEAATFLLTDCSDARDMLGHFPPICYAGQGWVMQSSQLRDAQVGNLVVHTTRYVFTSGEAVRPAELMVDNFMLLPGGGTCANMDGISSFARNNRRKFYGAGQIQLVYDPQSPLDRRDEMFQSIISANASVITAILDGNRIFGATRGENHQ